jgi:hypothetical protein
MNDQRLHRLQTDRKLTLKSVLLNFIDRNQSSTDHRPEKSFLREASKYYSIIDESLNKRNCQRRHCHFSVQIFDCDTGDFFPAIAHNYCHFGMYLESDYAPRIGSGIALRMDKQAVGTIRLAEIPKYHFCVMWRKELSNDENKVHYGIGIRSCRDLEEFLELFSLHSLPKIF